VRLWLGSNGRLYEAVLDDAGRATLVFRPTLVQILLDVDVSVSYVSGDEVGPATTRRLSDLL